MPCVADGKDGQQPVDVNNVPRKQHPLFRLMHHHVTWSVPTAPMVKFDDGAAKLERSVGTFEQTSGNVGTVLSAAGPSRVRSAAS